MRGIIVLLQNVDFSACNLNHRTLLNFDTPQHDLSCFTGGGYSKDVVARLKFCDVLRCTVAHHHVGMRCPSIDSERTRWHKRGGDGFAVNEKEGACT